MLSGQVERELETPLRWEQSFYALDHANELPVDYEDAIAYPLEAMKRDAPRRRVRNQPMPPSHAS